MIIDKNMITFIDICSALLDVWIADDKCHLLLDKKLKRCSTMHMMATSHTHSLSTSSNLFPALVIIIFASFLL